MAQTTKKSAPKKTTTAKKTTKASQPRKNSPSVPEKTQTSPLRRGIGAVLCLFLSLFSFIGYADIDAWFITYFCGFIKGTIGWGYYVFPPMLLVCAFNLVFFKEKNTGWRIAAALLTPLFFGSICHLFSEAVDWEYSKAILKQLYDSGKIMNSGGVLSGTLAMGMKSAVSIYGAFPVFLFGFVFFAMNSLGFTVPKLVAIVKQRRENNRLVEANTRQQSAVSQSKALAAKGTPVAATTQPTAVNAPAGRRHRKAIDIPIDEVNVHDDNYVEERVGFFNTKPRVRTPDQVFAEQNDREVPPAQMPAADVKPLGVTQAATVAGAVETAGISSEAAKPSAPSKKISRDEVDAETAQITKSIEKELSEDADEYKFPPIDLLRSGSGTGVVDMGEEIALNRERLESTIHSFGVNGTITGITRGPTVTRYDLELDQGVKLAKLTNLAGDLALSLGVTSVRIAPIPDKISTVGIEVPNKLTSIVYLRDIIESPSFKNAHSKLSFAIGKDIGGNAIIGNIAKLPHMLIAGTTGSGKSVCMNSLIISILYKATPEEVRLIMIDPKMVELGLYNGVPHLFVPVVTDPKKAAGALQWAVVEMLKRYRLFSEVGVRDLAGYNTHQKSIGEPTIPRVVIVIDELADLMLVASKEVEESVCRVAQMGRASGMHLIIATQRPSADVITGLMKANIPSRIAFAVSSAMESRIILDSSGAEKLIGAGDMLYAPLGAGKPMRIQGAFVSDDEREKVIAFVKESAQVEYSEDILAQIEKAAEEKSGSDDSKEEPSGGFGSDYDELLPQAVDVIFETKQASVSMLQRRLKLGYARAARIVDQMEELGIVGPFEGSKPRQLLVTKQQWQEMQVIHGTAPIENIGADSVSFSEYSDAPSSDWKD